MLHTDGAGVSQTIAFLRDALSALVVVAFRHSGVCFLFCLSTDK